MKLGSFITGLCLLATAVAGVGCDKKTTEPDNPKGGDEKVEASSSMVIYQTNPRFFAQSNCLNAVNSQLDRIAKTQADVLWIMPIFELGVEKAFGSPYCIRDFEKIESKEGTADDLKSLVNNAHKKGMKVILDWVGGHTAWDHPWIKDHPEYYKKDANGNIIMAMNWSDVAKLDYTNKSLCDEMVRIMVKWVKDTGIDGYRCDHAEGVSHDFWKQAIVALKKQNPDILMLGETGLPEFYKDGFDMIYDWDFGVMLGDLYSGKVKVSDFLNRSVELSKRVPEGKTILCYALNHDVAAENDVATRFKSKEGLPGAYVLSAFMYGVPMIYSSMDSNTDSGKLSFFDYNPLVWSTEKTNLYGKLNSIYKETATLRGGTFKSYPVSDVVCFSRSIKDHDMFVVVNISNTKQSVKVPMTFRGLNMTEKVSGSVSKLPAQLEVEPFGYSIYVR